MSLRRTLNPRPAMQASILRRIQPLALSSLQRDVQPERFRFNHDKHGLVAERADSLSVSQKLVSLNVPLRAGTQISCEQENRGLFVELFEAAKEVFVV